MIRIHLLCPDLGRKIGFAVVFVAVWVLADVSDVQLVGHVGVVVGVGVVGGLGVLVAGLAVASGLGVFVVLVARAVVRRFARCAQSLTMGLVVGYPLFQVRFAVYFLVAVGARYS